MPLLPICRDGMPGLPISQLTVPLKAVGLGACGSFSVGAVVHLVYLPLQQPDQYWGISSPTPLGSKELTLTIGEARTIFARTI